MVNIKYLGYNILKTDYKKLKEYAHTLSTQYGISKWSIYIDLVKCLFLHNTRFLDYFYFRFFDKNVDRTIHTNVWDMHLFHKKYNSKNSIIFRDKLLFRDRFKNYFNYPYFKLDDYDKIDSLVQWITNNNLENIVAKEPLGTVGKGVLVLEIKKNNNELYIDNQPIKKIITKIYHQGFTLFETFIEQHQDIALIYPHSINTIRIVTFLNVKNEVEIWGALIRIGYDKSVDNFDAGGLSAKVDLKTGVVVSNAKIKDPFINKTFSHHPLTGNKIKNIQIPYWKEVIDLINNAALEVNDVKTVGWDVAITTNGPTLIEGNDNWDKTHFELISEVGLNNRIKELLK